MPLLVGKGSVPSLVSGCSAPAPPLSNVYLLLYFCTFHRLSPGGTFVGSARGFQPRAKPGRRTDDQITSPLFMIPGRGRRYAPRGASIDPPLRATVAE